ncbi:Secretory carrier-associated membrane protein 1, partial [Hypsibius exemplaris]
MSDSNPFGDPDARNATNNPFVDGGSAVSAANTGAPSQNFIPSVAPTTAPSSGAAAPNDFSTPFGFYEDQSRRPAAYGATTPSSQLPTGNMAGSYSDGAGRVDTSDLRKRQEDLERKAAELDRRESALRNGPNIVKTNNWPGIHCGPIGPCFYQDFDVDIAIEYKGIVKGMYYVWLAYSLILVLDMIACIAYMATVGGTTVATTFGLSILWVVLFAPCSFLLWFRPLYKAFRSDSSMNFFIFFAIFSVQCGVTIVQCLGINACGTAGIINGLTLLASQEGNRATNIGVGIFMIAIGVLFATLALVDFIMLIRIHRIYRTTGASFAKAQQEFAVTSLKNPVVQQVAVDAAGRAAQDAWAGRGQF